VQTATPLTIEHRYLMTQRDELKLQFCAAAKPASQPKQERRNQCEYAGETTECRPKSPAFSLLLDFIMHKSDRLSSLSLQLSLKPLRDEHFQQRLVRHVPFVRQKLEAIEHRLR